MVLKLTQMIGKNVKLYDMVLQFLRTLFLRTRNVHYCTLRAELLMSLHDLDISEICSVDPCHKVRTQTVMVNLFSIYHSTTEEPQTLYFLWFNFVLHVSLSLVFFRLCALTVHLVFRRLHP